jgi:hypothetical protein
MRILKHFTANEVKFSPMPFKRELSMEAYLIENEDILALDNTDDVFSDVTIIQEELTLKHGRKSKNTDGRIDILVKYASDEYVGVVELKLGQLKEIHLNQLEDYLLKKDEILQLYRDQSNSDDTLNSDPNMIGILVGTSINADLAKKISNGCKARDSGAPIAALIVERFKGEDGIIYVTTDTYFKKPVPSKDRTKYQFNNNTIGKGRLVLEVIKQHVQNKANISYAELEKDFPKNTQGSLGVFSTHDRAIQIQELWGHRRHFLKPEELIKLADNTTIAVCNQWGVDNIDDFIKVAEGLGHTVKHGGG